MSGKDLANIWESVKKNKWDILTWAGLITVLVLVALFIVNFNKGIQGTATTTPASVIYPTKNRQSKEKFTVPVNVNQKRNLVKVGNVKGSSDGISTFCTCGGLIDQDCETPAHRVNTYNYKGVTENSKFKDKGWTDVMPYDQFIQQPNYEQQNTNWFDVMPYDIYQQQQ